VTTDQPDRWTSRIKETFQARAGTSYSLKNSFTLNGGSFPSRDWPVRFSCTRQLFRDTRENTCRLTEFVQDLAVNRTDTVRRRHHMVRGRGDCHAVTQFPDVVDRPFFLSIQDGLETRNVLFALEWWRTRPADAG